MNLLNLILDAIQKAAVGRHWKTSTLGMIVAGVIVAYYFTMVWQAGQPIDWSWFWGALAVIVSGRVLRDPTAKNAPTDPPAIEPGSGGNSGGASFVMLCVVAAASLCVILSMTGCGTVMPKLQEKTNKIASRIPGGSKFVEQFREYEGASVGMTELPDGYEIAWRNWYEGKEIDISKIIPEPYLRPATNTAVAIVSTNTPVPPATEPTSASSTNTTAGGGTTLSDKVGNL